MTDPDYDTQRDYTAILENQVEEGLIAIRRPASGQFLSALSCGLDLGIGMFLLFAVHTAVAGVYASPTMEFITAGAYSVGFILVILGRLELFTEHTTLAVLPVLTGRASTADLARLWVVVLGANILGGILFAPVAVYAGPELGVVDAASFISIASTFVEMSPGGLFVGAVFAGWLMGLLSWILTSARDTISRLVVILLVTFTIGFLHLPHSIAGNIEVLSGALVSSSITYADWALFEVVTVAGNAVGGVVFVALFKYGHAVRSAEEPDVDISRGD
ncbi:formate/nitrite transporter family protein [Halomarina litorea]|uniref:formate/nitrite transporter family protein n=1 Tax=Halomarina litorea TaxID=2961595 RepID=UPI0020C530B0|nr:formate/nitrite transporter family protein [Halomarina sp. BCD28]